MDAVWTSLREKGHLVHVYVRDTMMVLVDGVDMTFEEARALNTGASTIQEIATRKSQSA